MSAWYIDDVRALKLRSDIAALLLDPGEFLMKSTTMKAVTVVVALLAAMTFAKTRSTTNSVENGQLLPAEREHS
jgi:hypothetical protein